MIRLRDDHSLRLLWQRTISAQLHALGGLLVILGGFFLLPLAHRAGVEHFWGCLAFLITGMMVFVASTTVHFLDDGFHLSPPLRTLFNNLDHFSIYLFIAGTYTPFVLCAISEPWQLVLIFTVWIIAILGILYTLFQADLPPVLQSRAVRTGLFVLMGWTIVIRANEVLQLSWGRLALLVAGGLAYSIGAVVFTYEKPKLFEGWFGYHELWHTLVLIGAIFHYFLILSFYW